MTIARRAQPHPGALHSLFHVTAATIIPVLFVAVAVQGDLLQRLVRLADRAAERVAKAHVRTIAVSYLSGLAAILVSLYGAAGETQALLSLYWHRQDQVPCRIVSQIVLWPAALIFSLAKYALPE